MIGVEPGFKFKIDNKYELETKSINPRVFLIKNFLDHNTCNKIIDKYNESMYKSPEKHYSDDPEFHNYRTSETNAIHRESKYGKIIMSKINEILRFSNYKSIESPQLLKYVE